MAARAQMRGVAARGQPRVLAGGRKLACVRGAGRWAIHLGGRLGPAYGSGCGARGRRGGCRMRHAAPDSRVECRSVIGVRGSPRAPGSMPARGDGCVGARGTAVGPCPVQGAPQFRRRPACCLAGGPGHGRSSISGPERDARAGTSVTSLEGRLAWHPGSDRWRTPATLHGARIGAPPRGTVHEICARQRSRCDLMS